MVGNTNLENDHHRNKSTLKYQENLYHGVASSSDRNAQFRT
jgi:hypothetical protein